MMSAARSVESIAFSSTLEDVLPADHDHRVDPALEQRGDRLPGEPVALVLEPVDLDPVRSMSLKPAQIAGSPSAICRGRRRRTPASALRLGHRRLDLVQAEVVGDLLGVVDDVVQRRRQPEDVLAVDRRDEGLS